MATQTFFQANRLPVFSHLSEESRQVLEEYVSTGNRAFREHRMLDFFRSLDWISVEDIQNNPLQKFEPTDRQRILREIREYHRHQARMREESSKKRQNHLLRVFEYYREQIAPEDKILLEALRDYELDRTGRDVNWQHYFSMKSFKKIDEFVNATPQERQARVEQFKADVRTYVKNYEKLHQEAQCQHEYVFDFDAWCDQAAHTHRAGDNHRQQQSQGRQAGSEAVTSGNAYQVMALNPGCTAQDAKKRFRQLALQHHPDMPGGNVETMKRIVAAYELIKTHLDS